MYTSRFKSPEVDMLFSAMLALKDEEDCYRFFEDLCTVGEIRSMSQRLAVAQMLRAKATYHEIEEHTGASTATISRVNRCLLYGAEGYALMLKRLPAQTSEDVSDD